jgi:N-acetylated-alpha-linked acidic dipeptidase
MRRYLIHVAALASLAAALACGQSLPAERPRLGYSADAFARQHEVERRYQESVTSAALSNSHRRLTARPHVAGTEGGRDVAESLRQMLIGAGLEVDVHDYDVYLSYPRRIEEALVAPTSRRLSVREPALDADPDTRHPELGDAYIAYSPSADVTADVVYVNYGLPDDYQRLASLGITLKGRIAMARYARSHRAVKVQTAEQAGAVGVILFSDPADDGFVRGTPWPEGYWRGPDMPQRGNAKYSWFWHGDPLTPGEPAIAGVTRLDPSTAPTLPHIPVVALGWGEARLVLDALGGPPAPETFRGGLPIDYRVGPGAARVRIAVEMDNRLRPIRNLVARIRGIDTPQRMVLLGGHHDAWTFGGVDPGTGAAVLVEVATRLGQLAATGWRPRRTIGVAFWDAEEFGLVGSTEFAEHKKRELQEELIAYVNTDMYMTGRFDAGGVPSLRDFLVDVTKDVSEGSRSVHDGWRASAFEREPAARRPADAGAYQVDLKALGSGADFVAFQDHLGIPTLSVEFIGPNGYGFGTYHSSFDTRRYAERVADPGFTQGAVLARVLGTLALRLSGAEVLPIRFSHYARRLTEAAAEIDATARASGGPAVDVSPLASRLDRIRDVAASLERHLDEGLATRRLPDQRTPALNDRLARLEQVLCDDEGAPASRWYRHVIYGWNIYSLYDGQPFPGLAEALYQKDAPRVTRELARIERALDRMLNEVEEAERLARPVK